MNLLLQLLYQSILQRFGLYPVCRGDSDDFRHRFPHIKSSVTADDEGAAGQLIAQGMQCRLHEILCIVLLLEDLDGFS